MAVEAFDDVCSLWARNFVPVTGIYVGSEFFRMGEDLIHHSNLNVVILVLRRTPADTGFQFVFAKHRDTKDVCLDVFEETDIILTGAHSELFSDVFEKVYMANLYDDVWKNILCCLCNCRVIITRNRDKRVVHVLEFREELLPSFEALGGCEDATRKIMGGVVHTVQERNLLFVTLYFHVFSINNQSATEAFTIAIVVGDLVVVWKRLQLFNNPSVRRTNANTSSVCKGSDTYPLRFPR